MRNSKLSLLGEIVRKKLSFIVQTVPIEIISRITQKSYHTLPPNDTINEDLIERQQVLSLFRDHLRPKHLS